METDVELKKPAIVNDQERAFVFSGRQSQTIREGGTESHGSSWGVKIPELPRVGIGDFLDSRVAEVSR